MDEKQVRVRLTGTNVLLMSNGRMADQHDEHAQRAQLHGFKKPNVRAKKTKEDPSVLDDWYKEEERIHFFGLVYYDAALGFHLPADNLLSMAVESYFGYGSTKKGKDYLQSVLTVDAEAFPLRYAGPQTPEARYEAGLFRNSTVTNKALGGAKVRVLNPFFRDWSLEVSYLWPAWIEDEEFLGKGQRFSRESFLAKLARQGETFGIGAYRKSANFGNFTVEMIPFKK